MCHAFASSSSLGLSSACLRNTISNMVLHARAGSRKLSGPNSANAGSAVKNPVRVEKCFLFSSHWFTTITTNNAVMEKSTPVLSNESHCPISAPNTEPIIHYICSNKDIKKDIFFSFNPSGTFRLHKTEYVSSVKENAI